MKLNEKKENQDKFSSFFVTINTNQSYKEDDPSIDDDAQIFSSVIEDILNNIGDYITLPVGDDLSKVKDADLEYVVERGSKMRSLHTHIMIKFKHNSNVKLNYKKIKDKIKSELGLNNIYFQNKMVRANNENLANYLNKMK